jgi:hypothetical protein
VIRRLALLIGGCLALWVVAAVPAYWRWGEEALVTSAVAAGLCLVPAVVAYVGAAWALERSPQQQLLVVLGGTGLRMMVVLGGGLILFLSVPYFQEQGMVFFWAWVLAFYLYTLALEVCLVVLGRSSSSDGKRET